MQTQNSRANRILRVILIFFLLLITCSCSPEVVTINQSSVLAGKEFAVVVKSKNNLYNDRLIEGFIEIIESNGGTVIIRTPATATAEAQINIINDLIADNVECIAISANSEDALQSVLSEAMEKGIKVLSFDSAVNAQSRLIHVEQAESANIGRSMIDAAAEIAGEDGQIAILSTTNQAKNQNSWIEVIRSELESGSYPGLLLVDIVFGEDDYDLSYQKAVYLIETYPLLDVIIVPTAAAMPAVAAAICDAGISDKIHITGLGLPSDMYEYIGKDKVCPCMFLWNPVNLGKLAAYTALGLVSETNTGGEGEVIEAGEMGNFTVIKDENGGTKIVLQSDPIRFDEQNINDWRSLF